MSKGKSKKEIKENGDVEILKETVVSVTAEEHMNLQIERVMNYPTHLMKKNSHIDTSIENFETSREKTLKGFREREREKKFTYNKMNRTLEVLTF